LGEDTPAHVTRSWNLGASAVGTFFLLKSVVGRSGEVGELDAVWESVGSFALGRSQAITGAVGGAKGEPR
jgi:hypothetical protein